ncbi:MAG TPA: hypothetical protein VN901_25450, partial [Candidatus Acidoferrales bacterium]|nr:hypothetical protein [Candidatus Acidoferrales bacterium]
SVIQNAIICFNDTPPAGVILPFVANAANNNCAGNDPANNLMANSYYTNHLHEPHKLRNGHGQVQTCEASAGQCRLQHQ